MPTKAAAQIAIARARISCELIDCTTTVESPMKTTPLRPPRKASRKESGPEWETPMMAARPLVDRRPGRPPLRLRPLPPH
jgi:hypothetical protein